MWHIDATEEYLEWFREQEPDVQDAVLPKVLLLEAFGPQLGRPHADTLKGSRVKNLKELRARTSVHVLRVLYYFDENRQALLLIGGDKKGKNESDFYKSLIQAAETLIERYRQ
ncbi:MAG: type II toxin-antitoxin system RelE/ParE family toxin [Rectinemataceae bacterium]